MIFHTLLVGQTEGAVSQGHVVLLHSSSKQIGGRGHILLFSSVNSPRGASLLFCLLNLTN